MTSSLESDSQMVMHSHLSLEDGPEQNGNSFENGDSNGGTNSQANPLIKTDSGIAMQAMEDLSLRMSKKVAQLTKVSISFFIMYFPYMFVLLLWARMAHSF